MNQLTCLFEELDDETRAYLQEVRERRGNRTPGVYVGGSNAWPIIAFILGPIIMLVALAESFLSTKDAWAVAMLQTAGVMLGGWMVIYAFRRWFASSRRFVGFFTYFDPVRVYQAAGETVTVTDVSDFSQVDVKHQYSNGTYTGSRVTFDLDGRRLVVPVKGEARADLVEDYYRALVKLEEHDDRKWRDLPAAELGGVAKFLAKEEELPHDVTEVRLEVTETPEEPKQSSRAGSGFFRYVVIFLIGGLLFAGFWSINDPVRDERAFEIAKTGGAPGLRGYLLDGRNTRHRDEAQVALAKLYDAPVSRVESGVKDPQAREGFLAILNVLRESPQPVESIDVQEKDTPKPIESGVEGRRTQLRTDLADAIATYLGKDLIGFVRAPEGVPAHVELVYRIAEKQQDHRGTLYKVTWQLRLRSDPAANPIEVKERVLPKLYSGMELMTLPPELKAAVFSDIFGQAAPIIPPPPPPGEGDFD
jgi:hypothetical protein